MKGEGDIQRLWTARGKKKGSEESASGKENPVMEGGGQCEARQGDGYGGPRTVGISGTSWEGRLRRGGTGKKKKGPKN